jgi:hypothetical protein
MITAVDVGNIYELWRMRNDVLDPMLADWPFDGERADVVTTFAAMGDEELAVICRAMDAGFTDDELPVVAGPSGGPWLFEVPAPVVDALAAIHGTSCESAAAHCLDEEERDLAPAARARSTRADEIARRADLLREILAPFAAAAVAADQRVCLYIST